VTRRSGRRGALPRRGRAVRPARVATAGGWDDGGGGM